MKLNFIATVLVIALLGGVVYAQSWWRSQDASLAMAAQGERTRSGAQSLALHLPQSEPLVVPLDIIWKAIVAIVAPLGGGVWIFARWFWDRHQKDIAGIDARAQSAITELKTTFETNRKEMREGIIDLHRKVEGIGTSAQERHNDLMTVLLEMKK